MTFPVESRLKIEKPVVNVVLVEPEIPPNTGNIGRTVLGVDGCLHLIEPLGFQLSAKNLKRAGLDYWPLLSVKYWKNIDDLNLRIKRFFLFTKIGQHYFYDVRYEIGDYLVFGSESRGLPQRLIQEFPERTIQFPTLGDIRSYNLASCVHSAVMELIRQNQAGLQPYYRKLEREIPR